MLSKSRAFGVAVATEDVELVCDLVGLVGEEVARVGVARDEPKRLAFAAPADHAPAAGAG